MSFDMLSDHYSDLILRARKLTQEEGRAASEPLWKEVLLLEKNNCEAKYNLALALWEKRDLKGAIEFLEDIPESYEKYYAVLNQLGVLYSHLGYTIEAREFYKKSLDLNSDEPAIWSNYLLSLLYDDVLNPTEVYQDHLKFQSILGESNTHIKSQDFDPKKKLKIGFISNDFKLHSVAYFSEPLISEIDKNLFDVFLYSFVRIEDQMTQHLRGKVSTFRSIVDNTVKETVSIIRNDHLDMIIDLGGHTSGNGLRILNQRVAPIQISWLGYPHSTGLKSMDYRISDEMIDPLPESQKYSSETIVHLKRGCHSYRMPAKALPVAVLPCKTAAITTFICCNNSAKISPTTIRLWAKVLNEVLQSKIIIKNSGFNWPVRKEEIISVFSELGVDSSRLDIRPLNDDFHDHLRTYNEADIALDTFPYNGTTTTCEALWSGVPVLTIQGDSAASRHGASLLRQVGLSEWIAETDDAFIQKAVCFSLDKVKLEHLRRKLRHDFIRSSLGDYAWFARRFEACLRGIWIEYCRDECGTLDPDAIHQNEEILRNGEIVHFMRASSLALSQGNVQAATESLFEAVSTGRCPQAWVMLGKIADATKNHSLGIQAWGESVKMEPENSEYQLAYNHHKESLEST